MKKTSSHSVRAFTLVELMVTVAIIALLTGIIVTNLTSSRSKARDAKRISDLGQIQLALELYFDRCKQYPQQVSNHQYLSDSDGILDRNNGCPSGSGITLRSYISHIPTPPAGAGQSYYGYNVNSAGMPTNYVLYARLENYNEVVRDSLPNNTLPSPSPSGSPTPTNVPCSNANGSLDYCLSPN